MHAFKKSAIAAVAAAVLLVSLAACGSGGNAGTGDAAGDGGAEQATVIRVGTEGTYSPYSFHDEQDKLVGYDVEVMEAVADRLGAKVEWVEGKWDGLIAGLDAGQYDLVANEVAITDERRQKYLFSSPYAYVYGVVVTRDDKDDITAFEDLAGKSVAQTPTSNWGQLTESYGATVVPTNGFSESIQLVIEGRADATVNDNVTFLDYKKQKPDAQVKVAAEATEINECALLIRQGDDELRQRLDDALRQLRDEGKLGEISKKYFGEDISQPK